MSEHSHAERMPPRIELSAEELALLLGADRFAPQSAAFSPTAQRAAATGDLTAANFLASAPATVSTASGANSLVADALGAPSGAPRSLSDTDLVQAILAGTRNFEALALRAVRERTGEELARIVAGAPADAMIATETGTALGDGRAFVAPLAPDARAAWALWLRRWLELSALTATHAPQGLWDDATGLPAWPRLRAQASHRIAAARLRREEIFVALLRIEDVELWNRRSQILIDDAFLARAAAALDGAVSPGDELARTSDGGFVLVTGSEASTAKLANALRSVIDALPGDGPRSLTVHVGVASAPWDATDPEALLELAAHRIAQRASGR